MTFVGKVLVVVQVVLSVCFMTFAGAVYTVQTNWKKKADDLGKQVASLQSASRDADQEFTDYKTTATANLKAQKTRADTFQAQAAGLAQQVAALKADNERTATESNRQTELARVANIEAGERRKEALRQGAVNKNLHTLIDKLVAQVRGLEDAVYGRDRTMKAVSRRHTQLLQQVAFLRKVVRLNRLSTDPAEYAGKNTPPPSVTGVVLNTLPGQRQRATLIEISIGSDDGLVKGNKLDVYRSAGKGSYLGKIRIVYVTPDKSVGELIEKTKNGVIKRGDNATTKL